MSPYYPSWDVLAVRHGYEDLHGQPLTGKSHSAESSTERTDEHGAVTITKGYPIRLDCVSDTIFTL